MNSTVAKGMVQIFKISLRGFMKSCSKPFSLKNASHRTAMVEVFSLKLDITSKYCGVKGIKYKCWKSGD